MKKFIEILDILEKQSGEFVSSTKLASAIQMSNRSIARYIPIIEGLDETKSFVISSSKSKGYQLNILNHNKYVAFRHRIDGKEIFNDIQRAILVEIGLSGCITSNKLEKKYTYSSSSIHRIVLGINEKLAENGLYITKNNGVYEIHGDEIRIRNLLSGIINHVDVYSDLNDYQIVILVELESVLKKYGFYLSNTELLYILICILRVKSQKKISMNEKLIDVFEKSFNKSSDVYEIDNDIEQHFQIKMSQDEMVLLMIIISKYDDSIIDKNNLYTYLMPIITIALKEIDKEYLTSFKNDDELISSINYHIANSLVGYVLQKNENNKILEEIRLNLTNDYICAMELVEKVNTIFDIEINNNDIGFLTLHFANSREKNNFKKDFSIGVVYQKNVSAAKLIKTRLESEFSDIRNIKIVESIKLKQYAFDMVIGFEKSIEDAVMVSPFLTSEEIDSIRNQIISIEGYKPLIQLLHKDLFYIRHFENKKSLLDEILKDLKDKGYLSEVEVARLLQREKLSSTEIAKGVAFPHVTVDGTSFLAVVLLEKSIIWKSEEVNLVLMMGLNHAEKNEKTIRYLFNKIKNFENVNELVNQDSYENFIKKLRG